MLTNELGQLIVFGRFKSKWCQKYSTFVLSIRKSYEKCFFTNSFIYLLWLREGFHKTKI